ncbi:MAG: ornithine--oxo-acid transaminase [Sandaracinaceae bacterium]|nr:ornithine--oxo-acid transaminase [Sandaracinaceae bacterium]
MAQADAHGARNYAPLPVVLSRGQGAFVWDVEGKRYTDCLSGYSALNQGHCHPRIVEALVTQAHTLTLTSRAFHHDLLGAFLARLAAVTGFEKVLPMNSGAEAVETGLKAMRRWGYEVKGVPDGTAEIIVAENNFHGRTITAVSLSTDPSSYGHYGAHTPGFVKVPFGDIEAMARAMGPRTVGVLIEPIQGEAGVILPPEGYLAKVRVLCRERGVVMCLDEVQTGLGRTGKMFGWQHAGPEARPDAVLVGKALSGGMLPASALCADGWLMDVFTPGTHGSTYGGNPLACAVGLAALDVLEDEQLPERAAHLGERALARLRAGLEGHPRVKEIRGRGLMIAVQLTEPTAHARAVALAHEGVLAKDTHGHTLRVLPPLVIEEPDLDAAVDAVIRVIRAA